MITAAQVEKGEKMKTGYFNFLLLIVLVLFCFVPGALALNTFSPVDTAQGLVDGLVANNGGINVLSVTIDDNLAAASIFDDLNLGTAEGYDFVFTPGILITTGEGVPNLTNSQPSFGSSYNPNSTDVDIESEVLAGTVLTTQDAFALSFTFTVPEGVPAIQLKFMFASEEYPEYVGSDYVDGAVIMVDGVNYATFSDGSPLKVASEEFFVDNTESVLTIEYNGLSVPRVVNALLDENKDIHTIKIAIADTGDNSYDSALFLSLMKISYNTTPGIMDDFYTANSAPVLDSSYTHTLTAIDEDDITNNGNTIAEMVADGSITDLDQDQAVEAVAITGVDNSNGRWEYSLDNGGSWQGVGNPTASAALLLNDVNRLRFIPAAEYSGSASLTFRAWDRTAGAAGDRVDTSLHGGETTYSTVTDTAVININSVDDPPEVAVPLEDITVEEDAASNIVDLSSTFRDIDNEDSLISKTVSSNSNPGLVAAAVNGDQLTLTYQPDQYGTAVITVEASSGGQQVSASFTVTVNPVNDAPVINPIGDKTVWEGEMLAFTVTVSDIESEAELLELKAEGLPVKARLDSTSGEFTWQPSYGEAGSYQIKFLVSDGLLTTEEIITIEVTDVPRPLVEVLKEDIDPNGGELLPGEVLLYRMKIINTGQVALEKALLEEAIPSNTEYIPGSTSLNGDPVADVEGNSPLQSGLPVNSPGAAAGELLIGEEQAAVVEFKVRLDEDLTSGTVVSSQSVLTGNGSGSGAIQPVLSDDPDTSNLNDATRSIIGITPVIDAVMTVRDNNGGEVEQGDILTYKVSILNQGNSLANGISFENTIPEHTIYRSFTPGTDNPGISSQLLAGVLKVEIGELQQQSRVDFEFELEVNLEDNIHSIINQGRVLIGGVLTEMTDGDGNDSNGDQPTEIAVGKFPLLSTMMKIRDLNGGEVLPGDILEFSFFTSNIGNAPAADFTINIPLPEGLEYITGNSFVNGQNVADGDGLSPFLPPAGYNYGFILPEEVVAIRYQARIPDDMPEGTVITANASYTAAALSAHTGLLTNLPLSGSTEDDQGLGNDRKIDDEQARLQVGGSPGTVEIKGFIEGNGGINPESWIVELYHNGVKVDSRIINQDGRFSFRGLAAGSGYQIRLIHPEGRVTYASVHLEELQPGQGVEEILPLDPSGVVYNSLSRDVVQGAVLYLLGPDGEPVPADYLLPGQQYQQTGPDGRYRFDLKVGSNAPAGLYQIVVLPPAGYNQHFPSVTIEPVREAFDPTGLTGGSNLEIVASENPPAPGDDTTYYLSFQLEAGDPNIINNHIPLDPDLGESLVVSKTADRSSASIGDIVNYTICIENRLPAALGPFTVIDRLPAGFRYLTGTAAIDGYPVETIGVRPISWSGLTLPAGEKLEITYSLLVGTGLEVGASAINQVEVVHDVTGFEVALPAEAVVTISPEPVFNRPVVIGKVFNDRNGDGRQQPGEEGIAGIGIYTATGLYVKTDKFGRYHLDTMNINTAIGINFILKMDLATLPAGTELVSENPVIVRLTPGMMQKVNFPVTLPY